jgi:hypothetical protein
MMMLVDAGSDQKINKTSCFFLEKADRGWAMGAKERRQGK